MRQLELQIYACAQFLCLSINCPKAADHLLLGTLGSPLLISLQESLYKMYCFFHLAAVLSFSFNSLILSSDHINLVA